MRRTTALITVLALTLTLLVGMGGAPAWAAGGRGNPVALGDYGPRIPSVFGGWWKVKVVGTRIRQSSMVGRVRLQVRLKVRNISRDRGRFIPGGELQPQVFVATGSRYYPAFVQTRHEGVRPRCRVPDSFYSRRKTRIGVRPHHEMLGNLCFQVRRRHVDRLKMLVEGFRPRRWRVARRVWFALR